MLLGWCPILIVCSGRLGRDRCVGLNMRKFVCAVAFLAAAGSAQETKPTLALPPQAVPGAVIRISLNAPGRDTLVAIEGSMSGEPLHFHRTASGMWHAIGAISPDAQWCITFGLSGGSMINDLNTGRATEGNIKIKEVQGATFSADGKLLATASALTWPFTPSPGTVPNTLQAVPFHLAT